VLIALGVWQWSVRIDLARVGRLLRDDWISLGFVLLVISAGVSTIFSVSPLISWRGDHCSWWGLGTGLAYLILFFATRSACKTVGHAMPLLSAMVVATMGASAYAIVQALGWDPIHWVRPPLHKEQFRPFSTLGHPNSLRAYLAVTLAIFAEL